MEDDEREGYNYQEGRMSEYEIRKGFELTYTLQEGETYTFYHGHIIVCHPERPPKIINSDGTTKDLLPDANNPY